MNPRDLQILKMYADRRLKGEGPPTIREIASELGFKSPNSITAHIRRLVAKNYLTDGHEKSRGRTITEAGFEAVGYNKKYREVKVLTEAGLRKLRETQNEGKTLGKA